MSPLNKLEHPLCVKETMLCDTLPVKIGENIGVNNDVLKPIPVKLDNQTTIKNDINILKSSLIPHPPKNPASNGIYYDSINGYENKGTKFISEDSTAKLKSMLEGNVPEKLLDRRRKYNSLRNEFYKRSQMILADAPPLPSKINDEHTKFVPKFNTLVDRNLSASFVRRNRKYDHIQSKVDTNLRTKPLLEKTKEQRTQSAAVLKQRTPPTIDNNLLNQRRACSARVIDPTKQLKPIRTSHEQSIVVKDVELGDSPSSGSPSTEPYSLLPNTFKGHKDSISANNNNTDKLNFYSAQFCRERLKKDKQMDETRTNSSMKQTINMNTETKWDYLDAFTAMKSNSFSGSNSRHNSIPHAPHTAPQASIFSPVYSKNSTPKKTDREAELVTRSIPNDSKILRSLSNSVSIESNNNNNNNLTGSKNGGLLNLQKDKLSEDLAYLRSSYAQLSDQMRASNESKIPRANQKSEIPLVPRPPLEGRPSPLEARHSAFKAELNHKEPFTSVKENGVLSQSVTSAGSGSEFKVSLTESYLKDVNKSINKYLGDSTPNRSLNDSLNLYNKVNHQTNDVAIITENDLNDTVKLKERGSEITASKEQLAESVRRLNNPLPSIPTSKDKQTTSLNGDSLQKGEDSLSNGEDTLHKNDPLDPSDNKPSLRHGDSQRIQKWLESLAAKEKQETSSHLQHLNELWSKYAATTPSNDVVNGGFSPLPDLLNTKWMSKSMPDINSRSILKRKKRVRINLKNNKIFFYTPEYDMV